MSLPWIQLHATTCMRTYGTKRIIYLGTPQIAATVLQHLYDASKQNLNDSQYEIISVVTQPPALAGRNRKLLKSPVHELADKLNLPVQCPETAKDEAFLSNLENQQVDLFITAAYGNYLPKRFLASSKFGTINIHPSILPKYRGAAPIQRCLENGDDKTGVTLLYSVPKMDAGPIISQSLKSLNGNELAPGLLKELFEEGIGSLVKLLPKVFASEITMSSNVVAQKDNEASLAPKIDVGEGTLDFSKLTAREVYNKYRAFYDWPGISSYYQLNYCVQIKEHQKPRQEIQRLKLSKIILLKESENSSSDRSASSSAPELEFRRYPNTQGKDLVLVQKCKNGGEIGILELQPPNKKVMNARSFYNGFSGNLQITSITPAELNDCPVS